MQISTEPPTLLLDRSDRDGSGRLEIERERTGRGRLVDTSLLEAIRTLMGSRVSAAPVLDADRLVGVVSEHDIVALACRLLDDGD